MRNRSKHWVMVDRVRKRLGDPGFGGGGWSGEISSEKCEHGNRVQQGGKYLWMSTNPFYLLD